MRCSSRVSLGLVTAGLIAMLAAPAEAQIVTTFSNVNPILINDGVVATPSPSTITVAGLTQQIVKVRVSLNRLTHGQAIDLSIWLIAPGGSSFLLLGRSPYPSTLNDTTLQFDDCAPRVLASSVGGGVIPSGRYRPGVYPFALFTDIPAPTAGTVFPLNTLAGFNGSGASKNGTWSLYVRDHSTNGFTGVMAGGWSLTFYTQPAQPITGLSLFGTGCQKPDYDGDGRVDVAVYRPVTGEWWVINSSTESGSVVAWGAPASSGVGDIAVPADYDGDGVTDLAVYRQSTGVWYIRNSTTLATTSIAFGAPASLGLADTPVPGDYEGDGLADLAIYRAGTGEWLIRPSNGTPVIVRNWGAPGLGDYPARR
jgi:subtilisin-like proprotein convertase family protein